jgi:hypothetical protein
MSPAPVLSRKDESGDRLYTWGDPPEGFYSVTTIISGGVPKYLVPWAAKAVFDRVHADMTAAGPYSKAGAIIRRWAREGRTEVIARQAAGELKSIKLEKLTPAELAGRWIKGTPDRIRDAAAELGIEVHDEAERLVLQLARDTGLAWTEGRPLPAWPEHLEDHMGSFVQFLDDWRPEYVATEATVFNRAQAYAGTLDAIMRLQIGGQLLTVLVDYKSGNHVYSEVGLQLAAYRNAEFVGLPDGVTEAPMPATDAGAVLHITPRAYRLRLVRVDDEIYRAFLHAREVFRWAKQLAGTVLQQELVPEPAPQPEPVEVA